MFTEQPKIAVIGLGYVGLPLAIEFAKKYTTVGFDINQTRIDELDTDLINQQREIEGTENKIADNKNKLESNNTNVSSWEKQLKDVKQRIENLENNRKDKISVI